MPISFAIALAGASMTIRHNSILPAIALHMGINVTGAMEHFFIQGETEVISKSSLPEFLIITALSAASIFYFKKQFNELLGHIWYAWKDFTRRPELGKRTLALLKHWSYVIVLMFIILGIWMMVAGTTM